MGALSVELSVENIFFDFSKENIATSERASVGIPVVMIPSENPNSYSQTMTNVKITEAIISIFPIIVRLKCFLFSEDNAAANPNVEETNAKTTKSKNPIALEVS